MDARVKRREEAGEYFFIENCHITECWNSADDPAVSIARARVLPGVTTRLHRLHETVERYYILNGSGRVEIGALKPKDVGAGDTVIIPPACPQRITNTGKTDLIFLAICSPRFVPEAYEDLEDIG